MTALAASLALSAALVWGVTDFAAGMITRRLAALSVTFAVEIAGLAAFAVAVGVRGDGIDARSIAIGLLAGVGGSLGLATYFRALALGMMSIVSPIAACSALIPFAISIASGERPSAVALVGAALALAGAVAVSIPEHRSQVADRARAVTLAALAAVGFGVFLYLIGLGSRDGGALSVLLGARVSGIAVLGALVLSRRERPMITRRFLLPVVAIGLGDAGANTLFAEASDHGLLALVSVLSALYPLVTVLLAHIVLGERLSRMQKCAVGVALVGVCALAGS